MRRSRKEQGGVFSLIRQITGEGGKEQQTLESAGRRPGATFARVVIAPGQTAVSFWVEASDIIA
jgi:hypothetical protein